MKKIFENFWFKVLLTTIVNLIGWLMFLSAAYIAINPSIERSFLSSLLLLVLIFGGYFCISQNYSKLNDSQLALLSIGYAFDYLNVKHGYEKQGTWTFDEEDKMFVNIRNFIDTGIDVKEFEKV